MISLCEKCNKILKKNKYRFCSECCDEIYTSICIMNNCDNKILINKKIRLICYECRYNNKIKKQKNKTIIIENNKVLENMKNLLEYLDILETKIITYNNMLLFLSKKSYIYQINFIIKKLEYKKRIINIILYIWNIIIKLFEVKKSIKAYNKRMIELKLYYSLLLYVRYDDGITYDEANIKIFNIIEEYNKIEYEINYLYNEEYEIYNKLKRYL